MTIQEVLKKAGIPVAYSHFNGVQKPPFIVYIGAGQVTLAADNTYIWSNNRYRVEYYFTEKNEENEKRIEQLFLDNGLLYEKSDDIYIDAEKLYAIYYYVG